MTDCLTQAKHYRSRAKKLRTIAREWADSGTRDVLGRVARNYEHMAERLERTEAADRKKLKPK